jgi:hypothetical protein
MLFPMVTTQPYIVAINTVNVSKPSTERTFGILLLLIVIIRGMIIRRYEQNLNSNFVFYTHKVFFN